MAVEIGPSEGSQIPHPIDEKRRVSDAVFLCEFLKERLGKVSPTMGRTSGMKHDVRLDIDRRIHPRRPFFDELYLLLVDSYVIRFGGELLIVVLDVGLVPMLDGRSGSAVVIKVSFENNYRKH